MFFNRLSSKINFNKEVAKYLYRELKNNDINVRKENVILYIDLNKNENLLIDCLAGKVYHNKDNDEKYLCDLGNFKNKTHLGEAYNCAVFNFKKLIKKIENLKNNELIKESNVEMLDLRTDDMLDLRVNKIIVLINKTIYEGKNKFKIIKQFFKNKFNIDNIDFIKKKSIKQRIYKYVWRCL
jgi:hypothetical protein